jgi:hypothetical protein
VNLLSYIAPGDDHGALQYDSFYTEEVNGEKLVDWVTDRGRTGRRCALQEVHRRLSR